MVSAAITSIAVSPVPSNATVVPAGDLKIPLPDIVEQRRIARLLDCAYGVFQRTRERQESFENLLAAALYDAFLWAE
jgi:hypothetical protein